MGNLPIGIFDSGIGGLTLAHAIRKKLPNENIIYFGDTKHLPYGEKSSKAIQEFSRKIVAFLIEKQCKAIIIACNSASSVASNIVEEEANGILVFNVIDPVVNKVIEEFNSCNIGVIGTNATIKSAVYTQKIRKASPNTKVVALATPLLAPMIEEEFINSKIRQIVIENYLKNNTLANINQLILACTHYPLIHQEITRFYKHNVNIIDSVNIVAEHVSEKLTTCNLLNTQQDNSTQLFYVSNYTESFEKSAKFFFQKNIKLEEINLFD